MLWYEWLLIIVAWSAAGGFVLVVGSCCANKGILQMSRGWEFVNPIYVHKYNHVNWFGAFLVALLYNLLCPLGSIGYWIYKLCTVGR